MGEMKREADVRAPRETGGILLGYVAPGTEPEDVVVEAVLGPGPNAAHYAHRFEPDSAWQQQQLAQAYAESGRLTTYLGDWHTHPGGVAVPSRRDRRTARAIARSKSARMSRPIMLILASEHERWRAAAYRFESGKLHSIVMNPLD
jgi:integrative and conjugative element protein (TIGR02256 family)